MFAHVTFVNFVLQDILYRTALCVCQQQSVFVFVCHRPTLSRVQSAAISNKNTSCVASVMLRLKKKLI